MKGRTLTGCACLIALAGCGGGKRQDASEPSGNFKVQIVDASFPAKQSIADATTMKITVKNADTKPLPNVAVTVQTEPGKAGGAAQAFSSDISDSDVADPSRPIWIVDQGPVGGDTAYTNTWALGPLKPNETKAFEWRVTAVKPGTYKIDYYVSPGLNGKARPATGELTKGTFDVSISDKPPNAYVDDNGNVVRGKQP